MQKQILTENNVLPFRIVHLLFNAACRGVAASSTPLEAVDLLSYIA